MNFGVRKMAGLSRNFFIDDFFAAWKTRESLSSEGANFHQILLSIHLVLRAVSVWAFQAEKDRNADRE